MTFETIFLTNTKRVSKKHRDEAKLRTTQDTTQTQKNREKNEKKKLGL